MQKVTIIVLGLALLAYASTRPRGKARRSRFQQMKGWQKVFGLFAIIGALLIVLNPELLAFGFMADTAFFDLLVLALSLQMHGLATQSFHNCIDMLSKGVRWLGIPSPGLLYLLAVLTNAIAGAATTLQKAAHRLLS